MSTASEVAQCLVQLGEQTAFDRFVGGARKLTASHIRKVARFTTQPTGGRSPLARNLL